MKIQMTVKVVAGLLMVLACSSIFAQMKAVDVFTDWPRGAEPEVVSRRLTDLFLTTPPEAYKPVGYVRMAGGGNWGYGDKGHIHYSTVALWINAMECARLVGDTEREAKLMLADIDYAAGRTDAAIAAYAELVRFGAAERMSAAKTYAVGLLLAPDEAKICADALTNSESAEWRQAGYALLGDVEEKRGNSAAAAVAWGKSLAEDATTQCKASASLKLGLYEAAKGALDAAERHLTLAIKLSSKDGEARSRAYLALAKCALARNNVEDARKYATVVVTLFEKTASAVEAGEILRKNVK